MRPLEPKAKRTLKALLDSDDDATRLKAAELVYAYRYGRPTRRAELSAPDGKAIETEMLDDREIARQTALILYRADARLREQSGH